MVNNLSVSGRYKVSDNFIWGSYNPVTYRKLVDKIPDWSKKNILIVEDDETNAYLLKAYLKRTRATIIEVRDGQKAVDFCNSNLQIDLVLMDIRLPVLNGYEATQLIKSKRKDLPVIAQTAFTLKADIDSAYEAGCDDFLAKPISQELLFTVLSKYLG
jgi:two-component system, cell cycle response regulator DivK